MAPYHTKGSDAQYVYDAALTQAIGRARRYGQEKTVHVHHFLVKKTVDVDIMEFRTSKIVMRAGGNAILADGDRDDSRYGTSLYAHISQESE